MTSIDNLVSFAGLPAIFVGAFYGVTYYVYVEYDLNPSFIYGDVMNEREM